MLGHDYVAHQRESVAVARLPENLDEGVSGANGAQKRQPPIACEGDEMQMSVAVVANEFVAMEDDRSQNPDPPRAGGAATRKS